MKKRIVMEQNHRKMDVEIEMAEICSQVMVSMETVGLMGESSKMERFVRFAINSSLWVSG